MPRKRTAILLLSLLLLSGCGRKEPTQRAVDFRTSLLQSQYCSFTANIRADYGERIYDFSLSAEYTPEQTALTVMGPEEIAGISAVTTGDGTKLAFDGMELDFGKLANGHVTPILVPWILAQCWTGEYISCAGSDGELYRVTYLKGYDDEQLTVDTWFNSEGIPVHGEIIYGDTRCVTVEIEDFHM